MAAGLAHRSSSSFPYRALLNPGTFVGGGRLGHGAWISYRAWARCWYTFGAFLGPHLEHQLGAFLGPRLEHQLGVVVRQKRKLPKISLLLMPFGRAKLVHLLVPVLVFGVGVDIDVVGNVAVQHFGTRNRRLLSS